MEPVNSEYSSDAMKTLSITDTGTGTKAEARQCAVCEKLESHMSTKMKLCSRCKGIRYCSKECQSQDWNDHKTKCRDPTKEASKPKPKPKETPTPTSSRPLSNPNTRLPWQIDLKTYFSSLASEQETFSHLIDCYRMRVEDECAFCGNATGLYNGENPIHDFRKFLRKAEKAGMLPNWWNATKQAECERVATGSVDHNIGHAVEKGDIQEMYGDSMMPMTFRMLAERICGSLGSF